MIRESQRDGRRVGTRGEEEASLTRDRVARADELDQRRALSGVSGLTQNSRGEHGDGWGLVVGGGVW